MAAPVRILHAPTDVGGHAYSLSRAERALGLESDVVLFSPGPFGYGADRRVDIAGRSVVGRLAARTAFLVRALSRYEVFHFNYGQSILTMRAAGRVFNELPLLKRLGKKVVVTFQGCDVRPFSHCFCRRESCVAETRYRQPSALRALRYADRVFFLNPDLREWLPGGRFIPYANVDPQAIEPPPPDLGAPLRVAHAPTHRDVKGTRHVVEAVETLSKGGVSVELDLLEGLTRDEVIARCARADVVVDQLLIGWYGGFAVEAMALGKPVLCYVRESEPADNPFGAELPIVRTTPVTLAEDLRRLAQDAGARRETGLASRRFVERHHDPRRIARTILDGLVSVPSNGEMWSSDFPAAGEPPAEKEPVAQD